MVMHQHGHWKNSNLPSEASDLAKSKLQNLDSVHKTMILSGAQF